MNAEYYFNKKIKEYLSNDSLQLEIINLLVSHYKSDNYYHIFDMASQNLGFTFLSPVVSEDNSKSIKYAPTIIYEKGNKINKKTETEMLDNPCDLESSYETLAKKVLYLLSATPNLKSLLNNNK